MNLNGYIQVRGDLCIVARDSGSGEVVRRIEIRNKVLTAGVQLLADLLSYPTAVADGRIREVQLGTSSTAPTIGDTAITAPVSVPLTGTVSVAAGAATLKLTGTMASGTGNLVTYQEAGLFAGPTAAIMFARQVFPGLYKTNALVLDIDWRITFTAAP